MRLLFPVVLILLACLEKKYKNIKFYKFGLFLYFIFLSLRFMQGTDYYNYQYFYDTEAPLGRVIRENGFFNQFELFYELLVSIFRTFNLSFPVFVSFVSLINLLLIDKFIVRFSENKTLSLLILYLVYGIVFMESAIRQSIAMSIILGVCFVALCDKKIKKLLLGCVISFLFHKSAIFPSFILILAYYVFNKLDYENIINFIIINYKKIGISLFVLLIIFNLFPFDMLFSFVPGPLGSKLVAYFSESDYSFLAIGLRIYLLLSVCYLIQDKIYKMKFDDMVLYSFYIFSFIFYLLLCRFPMVSRFTVYFEILEIAIYSQLLSNLKLIKPLFKKTILMCYGLLIIMLFIKDGISTQKQSGYKKESIICPYYNIFDQERAMGNVDVFLY